MPESTEPKRNNPFAELSLEPEPMSEVSLEPESSNLGRSMFDICRSMGVEIEKTPANMQTYKIVRE